MIIRSYNRCARLRQVLDEFKNAAKSDGISLNVIAADNDSTTATRDVLSEFGKHSPQLFRYAFEPTRENQLR